LLFHPAAIDKRDDSIDESHPKRSNPDAVSDEVIQVVTEARAKP
jgi:hypothetical protein